MPQGPPRRYKVAARGGGAPRTCELPTAVVLLQCSLLRAGLGRPHFSLVNEVGPLEERGVRLVVRPSPGMAVNRIGDSHFLTNYALCRRLETSRRKTRRGGGDGASETPLKRPSTSQIASI